MKNMMRAAALGVSVIFASGAQAAVVGSDLTGVFTIGTTTVHSSTQTIVDPGVEFTTTFGGASFSMDVSEAEFTLTYDLGTLATTGAPARWNLSGFAGTITNYWYISGNTAPLGSYSFSPSPGWLQVDYRELSAANYGVSNTVTFGFTTDTPPAPVPLPAGGALMMAGLAGLGILRRRKGA